MQTLTQPSHPLGGHGDPHNVTLPITLPTTLPLGNVTMALPIFTTLLLYAEYLSFITLPQINDVRAGKETFTICLSVLSRVS